MRIIYADPPYIGQAKRHYSHDPRCAEVDHAALIAQLQQYDGWALSMSASMESLKTIIALAPDDARMGAWVKPFASFKPNVNPAYTWEPVLYVSARPGRREVATVKDHHIENITLQKGLAGAKPPGFCRWIFDLLGAEPTDEFIDLFPGTGIVTDTWQQWRAARAAQPLMNQLSMEAA